LLIRREQTERAFNSSSGRLHFGTVAGIKSERRPTSNRNRWPDCVGIRRPIVQKLDWELELGVVIGKGGFEIDEAHALDYVAGYTIVNDITARELIARTD
jgi:2-keto-4-pentenoate hydratase/2-oxohepta-3-ene-1,7-dioic acid hydratase in catechol pathway